MAIEAISALSSQTASAAKPTDLAMAAPTQSASAGQSQGASASSTSVNIKASGVSQSGSNSFAHSVSSGIYNSIDRVGTKLAPVGPDSKSMVDKAKQSMLPANKELAPVDVQSKPSGNEALERLSKTFDHAVFMAMVNQVVSGVSDTSRTLIKQA